LYTPEKEHFGIVPIEAMFNNAPVIACNSGGPKVIYEEVYFCSGNCY
ncbi:MAG: glycosyltransferase, partial [Thiothrix sp.]